MYSTLLKHLEQKFFGSFFKKELLSFAGPTFNVAYCATHLERTGEKGGKEA
jgi:hypothetical protein